MERKLFIVNTYFQLIMAVQMRYTLFVNDEVVLLLSDHSNNAQEVCNRLNENKIFTQTCYIKTKGLLQSRKKASKIKDFFDIAFKDHNSFNFYLNDVENLYFDEILCFNYNIDIIGLYSILYKYNKQIRTSLFEEGILSYGVSIEKTFGRMIIKVFNKAQGKKDISESLCRFYCFYPELYGGQLEAEKVPTIAYNSKCVSVLRTVFDIKSDELIYPQRYIFFTGNCDFEGEEPIGEYKVVETIAALTGKDNLIIKPHPRDTRNIYAENGYVVDKNRDLPWEIIQLSSDFHDKIYLTVTSGSVLAGSFMSEKPVRTVYLYNLCNIKNNSCALDSKNNIEKLLYNLANRKAIPNRIEVANKFEDAL